MANHSFFSIAAINVLLLSFIVAGVESIGVCYGMNGNNLPAPNDVIGLYKAYNIGGIRLYAPNQDVFQALRGSNIEVIVDVGIDMAALASDSSVAFAWVQSNIQPFSQDVNFRYITVGNELIPGPQAQNVLPAMQNVRNALQSIGLQDKIKVSTSVSTVVLGNSYPPSAGAFSSDALPNLQSIIGFLAGTGAPLLANVYPYFSYISNLNTVSLDYALFASSGPVVSDGQLQYQNLFDATVDALYAALEKIGQSNVPIVVSESGWPSDGGVAATTENAQTYVTNLIRHVGQGTPKRPGNYIDAFIFSMFDENMKKPQGTENNFGLFHPDKQPKYTLSF